MLAAARNTPLVKLPDNQGQNVQSVSSVSSFDSPSSSGFMANNAVPFTSAGGCSSVTSYRDQNCVIPEDLLAPVPPAKDLRVVLPWGLFAAAGNLDKASVEYIASELALSRLQIIDLPRTMLYSACSGLEGPWKLADEVAWVGSRCIPSPAVSAAASLHRLAHRCGGATKILPQHGGTAAVLTYRPQDVQVAAEVLAIYFHLYCGVDARNAVSAAGAALHCPAPPQAALESAVEEMAACGKGWLERVVLEWSYTGGSVELAGEVVGGWDRTAPLSFNVARRKWRLQLWGLPPGAYAFKFIVDGQWCIDMAGPSQMDTFGNINNVCLVPACSRDGHVGGVAKRVVDAADGMAAFPGLVGGGLGGDNVTFSSNSTTSEEGGIDDASSAGAPPQVQLYPLPLDSTLSSDTGAKESDSDDEGTFEEMTAEERLRSARFGAAILAYYTKSMPVRRAHNRRQSTPH